MVAPLQYTSASEFDAFMMPATVFVNVPTPVKDIALQFGSGVAAGFVRKRKVLPLLSWGDDLKANVAELAAYYLVSRRGYKPQSGSNETIRLRYDDAIAWLTSVSKGDIELVDCVDSSTTPGVDEASPLVASDPLVNWNYQTRSSCRTRYPGDGLG